MRIVALVLALLPAAAVAQDRAPRPADPAAPGKKLCANAQPQMARQPDHPNRVRPLGDEPRASQYYTVMRIEDGCDVPVKIRDDADDRQR